MRLQIYIHFPHVSAKVFRLGRLPDGEAARPVEHDARLTAAGGAAHRRDHPYPRDAALAQDVARAEQ